MKCHICNHDEASHDIEWFVTYEGFEPDDIKRGGIHKIELCNNCHTKFEKDEPEIQQKLDDICLEFDKK